MLDIGKHQAQQLIWSYMQGRANAAFFPSSNRHEFDLARRFGFIPESLFAIEKDAAVLANFTRKLAQSERKIMRRAAPLSESSFYWAGRNERIEAAHFDFTQGVNGSGRGSLRDELNRFMRSCFMEDGVLAISFMRARETGETRKQVQGADYKRVHLIKEALENGISCSPLPRQVKQISFGRYNNQMSSTPMAWVIFEIQRRRT